MSDQLQDHTGPENQRGHAILAVSITCGVLETIAVALRFLARRRLGAKWRIDDWLICGALVPNYGMIMIGGFMVTQGKAGLPKSALSEQELVVFLKTFYASMITYVATVTIVRISILLLLRRIFDVRSFRTITSVLAAFCLAWGISIIFANIFQCTPVSDAFVPSVVMSQSSRCIDLQAMFYGTLATAFTLDVLILLLPLHQIWRLQLPNQQKYELTAILGLGGLACVASVMRIVAIGSLKRTDLVYTGLESYMWSQIEPTAAILGACFATYRPLFRDMRLPSILTKKAMESDPTDVSRRWPTSIGSEKGSEDGLLKGNEAQRLATPENAR